ncbi:hypothetical protein KJ695_03050 [Patescibacteria group bacterium]|nr:hypothetical protein [Patescibacteria group bacterium]MBU4056862.1 hypothetical protein [Patescibacteria group bacterium]MBU4368407.1 hypothetical protein [Patescibacteria group bacterium]
MANGNLCDLRIRFKPKASVVKYVVPIGYPDVKSEPVALKLNKTDLPVRIYLGGVIEKGDCLVTTGSRAIAIRAEAGTIPEAAKIVNQAIPEIFCGCLPKLHWRPDIGTLEHLTIQREKQKN